MQHFDIIVIGGGLVGLATACGLRESGLSVALIEQGPILSDEVLSERPQLRASAINSASRHFLEKLDVWPAINATERVAPFVAIDVWEKSGFAKMHARAIDYGQDNLGYIIENNVIKRALWQAVLRRSNITVFAHARVSNLVRERSHASVMLGSGESLCAKLIVAADGAHSWVREQQSIPLFQRDYRHHALITTIETDSPHNYCARQIFYPEGIIAFLPLWRPYQHCLVWSMYPKRAAVLKTASHTYVEEQLSELTNYTLGRCKIINQRDVFPLKARYARQFAKHRLVLVGDTAHTIHPLAGLGVNLGFMDAQLLTDALLNVHAQRGDVGLVEHLHRYESARKKHALMMLAGMQIIQDTFSGASPFKKAIRGLGMNAVDAISCVKSPILKYAMGL